MSIIIRTWSFVSVTGNVFAWFAAALDIAQITDQVKMRLISQSVNVIARVLQKLLKYFNGTIILTFFVQSSPVEPVIFRLNLNEGLLPGKLSGAPVSVKESLIFLNNYCYISLNYTLTLLHRWL